MSPNGIYRLYLQSDGMLVIYKKKPNLTLLTFVHILSLSPIKQSKDLTISLKLILENNGNLVLYYYHNDRPNSLFLISSTKTEGKGGNKVVLQDDGNLVIYNNTPVWSSSTDRFHYQRPF